MKEDFTTLKATYRIVTPMFLAGADQKEAELRLASFKGALRFWWRTMRWGEGERQTTNVEELWKWEAELFGSSSQDYGQSKVRMRIISQTLSHEMKSDWTRKKGVQYLGYGVMNHKGELSRKMISGGCFTIGLRLGPNLSETQVNQIKDTLILLGTVGGLGSKSRKGYGSLTLTKLIRDTDDVENEIHLDDDPRLRIKKLVGSLDATNKSLPAWAAWSFTQETKSRVVFVNETRATSIDLLDSIGKEQIFFRSWGKDGQVLRKEPERNFPEDHHLSEGQKVSIAHPKRVAFGLPHNYGRGFKKAVAPVKLSRRASPLFVHIHQIDEKDEPVGVLVFLPSKFLPDDEKIKAFGREVPLNRNGDFWDPINGYLDRLLGKGNTEKKTSIQAKEVEL